MTAGVSKELNIHSQTVQNVCKQYVKSRVQHKKPWLRWRGRTSLGWIPFNTGVTFDGEAFTFRGVRYEPMHLRKGIEYPTSCTGGCFSQDARGRWYINIVVEVPIADQAPVSRVGIDLGLKALATLSDGGEIAIPQFYRNSEATLATTQRARKTRRIRNIHARIANRRKDFLHKKSAEIVKQYGLVVVGDVSPSKLAKTRLAKSVLDAGWAGFKHMLSYKAIARGGMCLEVSEAFTTQTCSECGCIAGPRGCAGLNKRMWQCSACGEVHSRDTNSAKNILRIGLDTLAEGASALKQGETPAFRPGSSHSAPDLILLSSIPSRPLGCMPIARQVATVQGDKCLR